MIYRGYSDEEEDVAESIKMIAESNIRSMDIEQSPEKDIRGTNKKSISKKPGMLPPVGKYIKEFE